MDPLSTRSGRWRSRAGRTIGTVALAVALVPVLAASALAAESPVGLGTAGSYALLGGSGLTNTGVSTISGDVGSSPTPSQTGFGACPGAPGCVNLTGTNHNDADPNDAVTQQAKVDLTTAYNDAAGRTGGSAVTTLGSGQKLVSGVYTAASSMFVGGDLTLDGAGDPNAVFIFQAGSTLITAAGTASGVPNTRVLLTGGAQACNVFWQVGTSATIETATAFAGNILADASITMKTGATVQAGRLLARGGAVTLDTNTVRAATCATPPATTGPTPTPTPDPTTTPTPSPTPSGGGSSTPTPGGTTAPASTTPGITGATPPAIAAAPTGTARIDGPGGPVSRPFTVSVTGREIVEVRYYVDGKYVGTVRAKPGRTRFNLRVRPRGQSRRVHRVTAIVRFTPRSGTPKVTRRFTYRRPAPSIRLPRFTG